MNGEKIKQLAIAAYYKYFEIAFWTAALAAIIMMPPTDAHASLCPLKASGITFCPGCGLAHSMSWFFHGNIEASFRAHPLGIAAAGIIIFRIFTLFRKNILTTN